MSSSKQLNTELLPEFCLFCDNYYTDPVMLPCLHTCCRKCALLNQYCKSCEEQYDQKGRHGSGFPNDLLLSNITAINNAIRVYKDNDESILCKNCCLVPTSKATNFCVECKVFICNFDTTAHVRFGSGKHNFIKLSTLMSSDLQDIIPNNPFIGCPNHPSIQIEYFCILCDEFFCEDCSKIYHSDHPKQLVDSFIENQREIIEEKAQDLEDKLSNQFQQEYLDQKSKLENQKHQLLEQVNKDFDNLIQEIRARRNTLVYSIISQHDERIKLLQTVYDRNEMLNSKIRECLEMIKEYTVTYPSKYILPLALTLTHRLDDFDFHKPDMDLDITQVKYNDRGLEELLSQFEKIGDVDHIREPKLDNPIAKFHKDILKSGWATKETDTEELTLVTTAVTMHSNLLVVFKTHYNGLAPPCSAGLKNESNFRITTFDPYSPTRNLFLPKRLEAKSVANLFTHKNGCTYIVDRVGKQLIKLDDGLNAVQTVNHNPQLQLLDDPVCICYDKTNSNFLVYNMISNNVNVFDMSLAYVRTFPIPVTLSNKLTRSHSEIHKTVPVSPRPRSKQSVDVFFSSDTFPSSSEDNKMSNNLAVNSKEIVFFVPNSKQALYVLDKEGGLLREISLKDSISEEVPHSPLQKQTSQDRSTRENGTLTRSRKRANSNPKRPELTPPLRDRTPNYSTFICINASDHIFIHQNSMISIFTQDLHRIVHKRVPEAYNPKTMNADFFGHIFLTTNDSILLC